MDVIQKTGLSQRFFLKNHIWWRNILFHSGILGTASDMANTVLFSSSEEASFVNGATLLIDGESINNWLPDF